MKNIQVIDSGYNRKDDIYSVADHEFSLLFPSGADLEFIEDFFDRLGEEKATEMMENIWKRPYPNSPSMVYMELSFNN